MKKTGWIRAALLAAVICALSFNAAGCGTSPAKTDAISEKSADEENAEPQKEEIIVPEQLYEEAMEQIAAGETLEAMGLKDLDTIEQLN